MDSACVVSRKFGLERAKVSTLAHDAAADIMVVGPTLQEEDSWANTTFGTHLLQTSVHHAIASTRKDQILLAADVG